MTARIAAVLVVLCAASCKRAPDPLAEQRATCEKLQKAGELKKGLSVEECAKKLAAIAAATAPEDPAKRADEVLQRLAALTAKGHGSTDPSQKVAVRDAADALARMGKPVVPAALAKMQESSDADFRIAVARVLVDACADDCKARDYSCIVPALLEGTAKGMPDDVRKLSERKLTECTDQHFGDDPAAWQKWFADLKQRGASTAAR